MIHRYVLESQNSKIQINIQQSITTFHLLTQEKNHCNKHPPEESAADMSSDIAEPKRAADPISILVLILGFCNKMEESLNLS